MGLKLTYMGLKLTYMGPKLSYIGPKLTYMGLFLNFGFKLLEENDPLNETLNADKAKL